MNVMTRRLSLQSGGDPRGVVWFAAAAGYVVIMALSASVLSWDIWAALVIAPILFTLTIPIVRRGLRNDPDPRMARLVMVALVAKLFGACARYALTFQVYEGRADAEGYHGSGARLAKAFWEGNLAEQMRWDAPELTGTPFINIVTGVVYAFTGPTKLGGFLIFAWLAFLGMFFFYKALAIGFPEANLRRYALLLFFMPTMLYWPSSLGKESWIIFALGLATFGVALILRHQPLGYPLAGLGLVGTAMPRPHITVLCFGALALAYMFRRKAWSDARMGPVGKVVGSVFEDSFNYMKSGTLLRQVINTIESDVDFNSSQDRHLFNDIYEKILSDLQSAGNDFSQRQSSRQHPTFVPGRSGPESSGGHASCREYRPDARIVTCR